MTKITVPISNDYCPQTLYLYGTYGADGEASFGLFCWASWCWHEGQLCFMAAIGESKNTQDRIRANGVFSANLVTEALLPFADRMGNLSGRNGGKRDAGAAVEKGRVLDVADPCREPGELRARGVRDRGARGGERAVPLPHPKRAARRSPRGRGAESGCAARGDPPRFHDERDVLRLGRQTARRLGRAGEDPRLSKKPKPTQAGRPFGRSAKLLPFRPCKVCGFHL